jgi:hypothetical protein
MPIRSFGKDSRNLGTRSAVYFDEDLKNTSRVG